MTEDEISDIAASEALVSRISRIILKEEHPAAREWGDKRARKIVALFHERQFGAGATPPEPDAAGTDEECEHDWYRPMQPAATDIKLCRKCRAESADMRRAALINSIAVRMRELFPRRAWEYLADEAIRMTLEALRAGASPQPEDSRTPPEHISEATIKAISDELWPTAFRKETGDYLDGVQAFAKALRARLPEAGTSPQ